MEIILASASPRRIELIKKISGITVKVMPSTAKEETECTNPYEYVKALAFLKAKDVFDKTGEKVIGADTIVVDGEKILGKESLMSLNSVFHLFFFVTIILSTIQLQLK